MEDRRPQPAAASQVAQHDAPDRVRNWLLAALVCALALFVLHALHGLLAQVH